MNRERSDRAVESHHIKPSLRSRRSSTSAPVLAETVEAREMGLAAVWVLRPGGTLARSVAAAKALVAPREAVEAMQHRAERTRLAEDPVRARAVLLLAATERAEQGQRPVEPGQAEGQEAAPKARVVVSTAPFQTDARRSPVEGRIVNTF